MRWLGYLSNRSPRLPSSLVKLLIAADRMDDIRAHMILTSAVIAIDMKDERANERVNESTHLLSNRMAFFGRASYLRL